MCECKFTYGFDEELIGVFSVSFDCLIGLGPLRWRFVSQVGLFHKQTCCLGTSPDVTWGKGADLFAFYLYLQNSQDPAHCDVTMSKVVNYTYAELVVHLGELTVNSSSATLTSFNQNW